jgi:hypothetical protein
MKITSWNVFSSAVGLIWSTLTGASKISSVASAIDEAALKQRVLALTQSDREDFCNLIRKVHSCRVASIGYAGDVWIYDPQPGQYLEAVEVQRLMDLFAQ